MKEMPRPATDVVASEYYTDVFSIAISRYGEGSGA
jgi:hypothetical protein